MKKLRRTVFVTGATSDIGRAIAIRFAQEGWDALCHYNTHQKQAKSLKNEIESYGVSCALLKADLASERDLNRLADSITRQNISTLINNAGTYTVSKYFANLSIQELRSTFMVNTFAPLMLSGRLMRRMKKAGFGRIINISSIASKYGGSSNSMHYGASKRALEGITKTLAKEGAAYNVLVNTIRPGVINTQFHKKFPKNMKKRVAMIPLKKMGTPDDIADITYYLGSEKNTYITNETITVAGGE